MSLVPLAPFAKATARQASDASSDFLLTTGRPPWENFGMNSQRFGLRIASIIFGFICLVHIYRLLLSPFAVQIGSHQLPVWGSGVAAIIAGLLSLWMWRLASRK
jgi:hypothetical protein